MSTEILVFIIPSCYEFIDNITNTAQLGVIILCVLHLIRAAVRYRTVSGCVRSPHGDQVWHFPDCSLYRIV